jgi:hypothetical protein
MGLKEKIVDDLGFDPDNPDSLENYLKDGMFLPYYIIDIMVYFHNLSEDLQIKLIEKDYTIIGYLKSPTIKVQKLAIELSNYSLKIIARCPDWKEFEQEILDNLIIKDIIQ